MHYKFMCVKVIYTEMDLRGGGGGFGASESPSACEIQGFTSHNIHDIFNFYLIFHEKLLSIGLKSQNFPQEPPK